MDLNMDLLLKFSETSCRTCTIHSKNTVNIEDTFVDSGNGDIAILDILQLFSDFKLNTQYPNNICSDCIQKAVNAYKFKVQCDKSNELFQDFFLRKQQIDTFSKVYIKKQEVSSDNENEKETENPKNITANKDLNQSLPKIKDEFISEELGTLFICYHCNKSFTNKYILTVHIKRHQNKDRFVCNYCGKGFSSQGCLTRHFRIHTGEKKYECEVCLKKFQNSYNLNSHSRKHSGIKPYLCTICGKCFAHPTGLTYHMRTHTKEKPYLCEFCEKSFTIQCHLDRHRKTHTGERPFHCTKLGCTKAFIKKVDLQRHEAIHSGDKPHVCNICNKAFIRRFVLNYHMMVHTKERPHVCQKCGRGFIRKYYLTDHMKKRHGKEQNLQRNGE